MTRVVWQPVDDGEYDMGMVNEPLYVFGNTDPEVCTHVEYGNETVMLDLGMTICIATKVDEPVAIPVEAIEALLSWREHGKAYDTVRQWLDSLKGGQG